MQAFLRCICLLLCFIDVDNLLAQKKELFTYDIKSPKKLREFFRKTDDRIPLMCAHRGGATVGFPENAIETFENTLSQMYAFFEVDPRLTKDSVIVLMHDRTLNRTTNGKGRLSNYTYEEVRRLRLRDLDGNLTNYQVPTLEEVILWSKGKTILMIDKKDVPLEMILNLITKLQAESHVILSTSDPEDAKFYHSNNKNIMFEAFIKNEKHLADFEATGIPWENFIAYVGQPKKVSLYKKIHEKGMMTMVYTAPVLEKEVDKDKRLTSYNKVLSDGVDLLLSDAVFEIYPVLQIYEPLKSKKRKYLKKKVVKSIL